MVATGNVRPGRVVAYLFMSCVACLVLASFWTLCHCAAFWLGRADALAGQGVNVIITFSLHPPSLFPGSAGIVFYAIIPAGLVSWLPASLVREWSWLHAAELLGGVSLLVAVTALVWHRGLSRYESGNLTQAVGD